MNASALLTSQGWLGPGHALDTRLTDYGAQTYKQKGHRGLAYDPTTQSQNSSLSTSHHLSTGNGLVRPLLISQRHGLKHGIGKKVHEPASGNEWWLKGFASALANVGKSESERSSAVSSGTSTPRGGHGNGNGYVGKHGGLYSYFTGGTVMKGTIEEAVRSEDEAQRKQGQNEQQSTSEVKNSKRGKKRKSDVLEEEESDGVNNSNNSDTTPNPLSISPVKKPQTAQDLETSIPYLTERDKSRKKAHKHAKSNGVEAFTVVGEFLGVTKEGAKSQTHGQRTNGYRASDEDENKVKDTSTETTRQEKKEERRARRRRRKEEREKEVRKEMKKSKNGKGLSLAQMVEEELAKLSSLDNSEVDRSDGDVDVDSAGQEGTVEKAKRKKKRKEVRV